MIIPRCFVTLACMIYSFGNPLLHAGGPNISLRGDGCDKPLEFKAIDIGYQWRPYDLRDLSFPDPGYLGEHDFNADLEESVLRISHGLACSQAQLHESRNITRVEPGCARPLPSHGANPYFSGLKFRQGAFHLRKGRTIQRRDPVSGVWRTIFKATKGFSQFEILPRGKIALICPNTLPDTERPIESSFLEMLSSGDNANIPLMEIYDRTRPGRPEKVFPYPESVAPTLLEVNSYPLVDRITRVEDQVLLVSSQAGQIFHFDISTGLLKDIQVPWARLDGPFMKRAASLGLKPPQPYGGLTLSQVAFPLKVFLYPQGGNNVLVVVLPNTFPSPGFSLERDAREWETGGRFVPLAKEFTPEERMKADWILFYRYDTLTRTMTQCHFPRLLASSNDPREYWFTLEDEAIPFTAFGMLPAAERAVP